MSGTKGLLWSSWLLCVAVVLHDEIQTTGSEWVSVLALLCLHPHPYSIRVPGHTSVQQTDNTYKSPQTGEMLTAVRDYMSGIFWHFGLM